MGGEQGVNAMHAAMAEHAAEVLSPMQQQLVAAASDQVAAAAGATGDEPAIAELRGKVEDFAVQFPVVGYSKDTMRYPDL